MNDLNSIILEGTVVDDPVTITDSGKVTCRFYVGSKRYYKRNDEMVKDVSTIEVECRGKLAQTCSEILKKGRGVRICGYLKQELEDFDGKDISKVYIVAENIEFKPEHKPQ